MAEVVRYVDTDVAAGDSSGDSWVNAYASLSAWEAAEETDLVSAGDWHHVYCRASSGTADNTNCDLNGWTTGVNNYILIESASGDEALKTSFDTSRYVMAQRLAISGINTGTYITIDGLQFDGNSFSNSIICSSTSAGTVTIKNCRFRINQNGYEPIELNDSDDNFIIENCIIGYISGTADHGIQILAASSALIYNNIIYGAADGIQIAASTNTTVKNNAIWNCTDDINDSDTSTIDYNSTDDVDGTNNVVASGSDYANEYTDYATGDFTIVNTGNLFDGGVGPGTDSNVPTTDIEGDARAGATCSIGVDEYVAAGGTNAPTADLQGPLVGCLGGPLMYKFIGD